MMIIKISISLTYLLGLQDHNGDLVALGGIDQTLIVTVGGLVGDPAGLLGVIGLGLKLDLQLRRDNQPGGWIWIGSIRLLDITRHLLSLFCSNLKILKKIRFSKRYLLNE
jgi:hypothetical protein